MDAHISCSRIPLIGPRHRVAPPQSWQTGFSCAVGCPRIRHYGLLANANRKTHIATARELLHQPTTESPSDHSETLAGNASLRPSFVCRHCGAPMLIIETFARAQHIRGPPCPSAST